jgi:hypothetical protein
MFRYFETELKGAAVPPKAFPEDVREPVTRGRPILRNLAVHAAVVAVCVGSVCAFPAVLRIETPLRKAISTAVEEKAYMKYLPSAEILRESVEYYLNRRNKT